MTNQRSIILLLIGAVVMVVAVFAALQFAGSGSDEVPFKGSKRMGSMVSWQ